MRLQFGMISMLIAAGNFTAAATVIADSPAATWDDMLYRIGGLCQTCTATGLYTTALGDASTAMGYATTASGNTSTAMGASTTASGETATAIGAFTVASGRASLAMGAYTVAQSVAEVTIGRYNELSSSPDPNEWDVADAILRVGNGTSTHRSDALRVMKSGVTQIKALHATTLAVGGTDVMVTIERMSAAIVHMKMELAEARAVFRVNQAENMARYASLRLEVAENRATRIENDEILAADLSDVETDLDIHEDEYWNYFWASAAERAYGDVLNWYLASPKLAFPDFRGYFYNE